MSEKYDSVLAISDAHVGLPDDEIFREDFESFITFLSSTRQIQVDARKAGFQIDTPQAIVLLGDFLDLWDGRLSSLPNFSTQFVRMLTEIADVYYLRGNHDYTIPNIEPAASSLKRLEICEKKVLEIGGKSFFFIHGHQFMSFFGPTSLKIESYVNPFYTVMEGFLSKFTRGHGKLVLHLLSMATIVLGLLIALGLPTQTLLALCSLFGLLLPVGFVTIWRVAQKRLWKFFILIFGELINSLRGATRGDTIEYLTSCSRPIFRWFESGSTQSKQAKETRYLVFGHTHIPDGPRRGSAAELREIRFLNTGSWMRPTSRSKLKLSEWVRRYTRPIDRFDEGIVIILAVLTVLASLSVRILFLPVLIADAIMVPVEILVALGKSSYRRLPQAGFRSLAFIGKDASGVFRKRILYWNPATRTLSTICHA